MPMRRSSRKSTAIRTDAARVSQDSETRDAASRAATTSQMQMAIVFIILGVAAAAWLIGRGITRLLLAVASSMKELASGNFNVVLAGLGRKDEVGEIAAGIETFKLKAIERARREAEEEEAKARAAREERAREMQRLADMFDATVGNIATTVSAAATQLEHSAKSLTNTAETTQQLSSMVAESSEQASMQCPGGGDRERGAHRFGWRDQPAGRGIAQDRRRRRASGGGDGRPHQRALVGGRPHR